MIRLLVYLLASFPLVFAAAAQEAGAWDAASEEQFRETQELIERMRAKVEGIDSAATARDRDIEFLNKKIEEAIGMISSGREENTGLRDANTNFQMELKELYQKEGELNARLDEAATEREKQVADLESRITSLAERLGEEQRATDGLQNEVRALVVRLKAAEEGKVRAERRQAQRLREIESLVERLGEEQRATNGLQNEVRALAGRLKAAEESKVRAERRQAQRLKEIESLKGEISTLKEMLSASRRRTAEQEAGMAAQAAQLSDLERRLKAALARKVEELSGYRSEFFGRLRQALGGRKDVRMEGDRFVFQSEVLFASGKASLDPRGQAALAQLARTLNEVARKIPDDLNWILRVDGHTDRLPIRTDHWQSNWELSTARALSVVRFLIEEGIPPRRLAAAGFGKFQPLDPRDDEIAYRRNRRIEFKLTQR